MILLTLEVGGELLQLSVRSPRPLSDDKWHRVQVEKNIKEAVLLLDGQHREIRAARTQAHGKLELYTDLFLGKIRALSACEHA